MHGHCLLPDLCLPLGFGSVLTVLQACLRFQLHLYEAEVAHGAPAAPRAAKNPRPFGPEKADER